jgi:uncharacterized RDD family membrane protein YckC
MAVAVWPGSALLRSAQAREARPRRFVALLLDIIGFSILSTIMNNVYGVAVVTSGTLPTGQNGLASWSSITTVGWFWLSVVLLTYYIVPESLFGASFGKLLTGLRVVRVDGRALGLGSVVTRNVLRLIDGLPFLYLVGGLFVLGTASSQRLGDLAAGTTVVTRNDALEFGATRTAGRPAGVALAAALLVALFFTLAFDYFGRPPLALQGLYNQHQLLQADVTSYELGTAKWSAGQVTYPITIYRGQNRCTGSLQMDWYWTGWQMANAEYVCSPSS